MSWPADRASGLKRLASFAPRAGRSYRAERNYDRGPARHLAVSGLSPYLRTRLVSESEVLEAVLAEHSLGTAEKFVQEVFWRGYWKGWLEHHPDAWLRYGELLEETCAELAADDALALRIAAAEEGETGIDAFDAWARELKTTGYLHNHARMWFASIWIFTLKLPWSLGADFFLRHLLDGDQASNTLSWRWVAGLHTRGKLYLARPDNIQRYTEGRFQELRTLVADAEPLEDEPFERSAPELPVPLAGTGPCGVLLTDEDLTLPPVDEVSAVVGLLSAPGRSPLGVSPAVESFARGSLEDALRRGAAQWQTPAARVFEAQELDALVAWVREAELVRLVVSHLPTGPASTLLARLRERLPAEVTIETYLGDYDRLTWPHAGRGFFQLKKKIPRILEELAIS